MARSLKGSNYARYLALMSRMGGDIERMPPRTKKVYLKRRLRLVDEQIRELSDKLDAHLRDNAHDWTLMQKPFDEDRWAVLVSLDYLITAREALKTAIRTL